MIRFGTSSADKYPGWEYIKADGPKWKELHAEGKTEATFEAETASMVRTLEKALSAAKICQVMFQGGHVEKGYFAKAGVKKNWSPDQLRAYILKLLPKE